MVTPSSSFEEPFLRKRSEGQKSSNKSNQFEEEEPFFEEIFKFQSKEANSLFSHLTKEQLAYYAGFLDGDGSISGFFTYDPTVPLNWRLSIKFSITQAWFRRHFLVALATEIGVGSVHPLKEKCESIVQYVITDERTLSNFLPLLLPFLRIKNKQAELTLELLKKRNKVNGDLNKFFEAGAIVEEISSLNDKRGPRLWSLIAVQASFLPGADIKAYREASKLEGFDQKLWVDSGLNPNLVFKTKV